MPAQSQQQQKLFGLALAFKRGEVPSSEVSDEIKAIADRMSEKEIEDFAKTKHKGLPKMKEQLRKIVREIMREQAISELNEGDGLWANIRAKQKRGEKPAHGNSQAHKDAVKAGKKINKESVNELNARLNKKVKSYLDAYLKGEKKNSPEHQHAIMLIMKGALTDANFHSEAKKLDKLFPKAKQSKYVGTKMEDVIEDKGIDIAGWAKWDGYDIIDAFAFYTNMNIGGGFGNKLTALKESLNEGKFKVDDLVYNKRTKTVGIVRMGDDKYGEVKTDADGNVDVDELEKYNPIKFKHQTKAKVAPSTEKEVSKRGLFNPFKNESINEGISVFDERHFGNKGIIIMIDDNGKKVSAIFKDKKNADKYNRNNPSDIKKLLDLAKKTKYPKAIDESVNEAGEFAGWIAGYNGKRVEIKKGEAKDLYNAKLLAIKKLKVPKSKVGLMFIKPAVDESVTEGYGEFIKAKNLTDIVALSKKKKNAVFYVTDDNNSRIGTFYLKNGKFAKATSANPNYDLQNSKTTLRDRSDVIYKYKVDESVNESASKEAMGIAALTGTRGSAVEDFINKHELDGGKLFRSIKKANLRGRLNFVSALAGKDGNPNQKLTIKLHKKNESINEGPSTEEKRIAMLAVRKQAKYRNVSLEMAVQDQINALEDLKRDIKKGKIKK